MTFVHGIEFAKRNAYTSVLASQRIANWASPIISQFQICVLR